MTDTDRFAMLILPGRTPRWHTFVKAGRAYARAARSGDAAAMVQAERALRRAARRLPETE